jgi:IS1 family transposase
MNKVPIERRAQILGMMVEGVSIRAIARLTGTSKNTITKLLADAGRACADYQDHVLRNLTCKRIQVDETWSFVYSKQRHAPDEFRGTFGFGDVWTWTAIDADAKLVPTWFVGTRNADAAWTFMHDLAARLAHRVQLTSDAHGAYSDAVDWAIETEIDYSQLVKRYGPAPEGQRRCSPPVCVGADKRPMIGNPDKARISTSNLERQNLTMRMHMRRFTRLTNAFSKKVANHEHAIALYFMHYNFSRVHQTLRVTPAMEAGVADHVWTMEEVVGMVDAAAPAPAGRGPYRPRISN